MIAPLLLLGLLGVLGVGAAINQEATVRHALERAGRTLQLNTSMTVEDMETVIEDQLAVLGYPDLTVSLVVETPATGISVGHVTVQYEFDPGVPLLDALSITFNTAITVALSAS